MHEHILELCKEERSLPPVSIEKSTEILLKMKKNVRDIHNITALHFTNAGEEGLIHFNQLLNAIVSDVNNAGIEELNKALGLVLYKGHAKDKFNARSYRTISS